MGEALVGAMVAAMRRANRDWAETPGAPRPQDARRAEGSAWGCLAHPQLMPTVFSPSGDADESAPGEEVAARKV